MKNKLELGCGQLKKEGYYGVDKIETEQVDQVIDLDQQEWDLPENHFTDVRAKDLFEHLDNPVQFMENLYRIMAEGGTAWIQAPHRSSQNWTDPTHKRLTGHKTIEYYFSKDGKYSYYSNSCFEVVKSRIVFPKRKVFLWNYVVEPLVNLNDFTKTIYEESFLSKIFPAKNMSFLIRK